MTSAVSRRTFLAGAGATGVGATIGLAPGIASAGSSTAATIIKNARVFVGDRKNTIDTGIAVGKDGRILATGRSSDMYAYQGKNTQVVDAQGGTVMAGYTTVTATRCTPDWIAQPLARRRRVHRARPAGGSSPSFLDASSIRSRTVGWRRGVEPGRSAPTGTVAAREVPRRAGDVPADRAQGLGRPQHLGQLAGAADRRSRQASHLTPRAERSSATER